MIHPWDTIGHQKQIESLEQEIKEGKIAHAYLFFGPPQTGKHRIARTFASILQCQNGYCRVCDDCKQIQKRCHPDTLFIEDDGESIKIDQIRNLIEQTSLRAHGKYRVVVIENIERMPTEAQNSFLKILEEPMGRTLFMLTTNQIDRVLPTIQSRARLYYFPNIDSDLIRAYLHEKYPAANHMDDMVNVSQGRPGMAIRLAENPELLEEQFGLYRRIEAMLTGSDLLDKMLYVEEIEKDTAKIDLFLDAFTRYLRTRMYRFLEHPESSSASLSMSHLVDLYENLKKTQQYLDLNANKRLVLENFMLKTEIS